VGVFDQAARYACRLDPAGFARWAVPAFAARFAFARWADTRTVPFPREPDRTCDTVAEFAAVADPGDRRLVDFEFQAEPDPDILERLAEYALRLRGEVRPAAGGKYRVHSVVLNLTGPVQDDRLDLGDESLGGGHVLRAVVRTLREEDAAGTLAGVAAGELGRCVLPWVPLMRAAGEESIIQEWRRLAGQETDARLRGEYGALALIFVELANRSPEWRKGLEGWNVRESQQVLEWKREAQVETTRKKLMRAIQVRLKGGLPEDLAASIEGMTDLAELDRWFDAALQVDSLDAFRATVGGSAAAPPNGSGE
jgi:hypothetical protein